MIDVVSICLDLLEHIKICNHVKFPKKENKDNLTKIIYNMKFQKLKS
jgi:hypothetical protein